MGGISNCKFKDWVFFSTQREMYATPSRWIVAAKMHVSLLQACGANTFQMLKWFEHVYSYDHGQVKPT